LPGGSENQIMDSLKKLLELSDNTQVFPGHGEKTTIGWERKNNPFLINI
jgi:glyoxylase-like metal-dependent hydrolase (beta-lactamase superfamily II)